MFTNFRVDPSSFERATFDRIFDQILEFQNDFVLKFFNFLDQMPAIIWAQGFLGYLIFGFDPGWILIFRFNLIFIINDGLARCQVEFFPERTLDFCETDIFSFGTIRIDNFVFSCYWRLTRTRGWTVLTTWRFEWILWWQFGKLIRNIPPERKRIILVAYTFKRCRCYQSIFSKNEARILILEEWVRSLFLLLPDFHNSHFWKYSL